MDFTLWRNGKSLRAGFAHLMTLAVGDGDVGEISLDQRARGTDLGQRPGSSSGAKVQIPQQ